MLKLAEMLKRTEELAQPASANWWTAVVCCHLCNRVTFRTFQWTVLGISGRFELVLLSRTCSIHVQTHINLMHVRNENSLERYGRLVGRHVSPLFLELNVEICQAENVRQSGTVHFRLPRSPRR